MKAQRYPCVHCTLSLACRATLLPRMWRPYYMLCHLYAVVSVWDDIDVSDGGSKVTDLFPVPRNCPCSSLVDHCASEFAHACTKNQTCLVAMKARKRGFVK
jgi:hypothetical protein